MPWFRHARATLRRRRPDLQGGGASSPRPACSGLGQSVPRANSAISCGVAVSKPTTSSMPQPVGSAIETPFETALPPPSSPRPRRRACATSPGRACIRSQIRCSRRGLGRSARYPCTSHQIARGAPDLGSRARGLPGFGPTPPAARSSPSTSLRERGRWPSYDARLPETHIPRAHTGLAGRTRTCDPRLPGPVG
jgi:hypothetical protein